VKTRNDNRGQGRRALVVARLRETSSCFCVCCTMSAQHRGNSTSVGKTARAGLNRGAAGAQPRSVGTRQDIASASAGAGSREKSHLSERDLRVCCSGCAALCTHNGMSKADRSNTEHTGSSYQSPQHKHTAKRQLGATESGGQPTTAQGRADRTRDPNAPQLGDEADDRVVLFRLGQPVQTRHLLRAASATPAREVV
jgi:hypothetical protein